MKPCYRVGVTDYGENLPGFLEEGVELVPPVHRQAALREPEHGRRVLCEGGAGCTGVAGAIDHQVLQGAAEPEPERGECCKKEKNRRDWYRGAHSMERCHDRHQHGTIHESER